jgi:hypothetical protein
VESNQFEKAKTHPQETRTAITAVTPKGEQVYIWVDKVQLPSERKSRCLHDLGQGSNEGECLSLERVTYEAFDWKTTGKTMFWGGLMSIPITFLAFPFAWKSGFLPMELLAATFLVGFASMLTGPFLYWANDSPTPIAPGPSPGFPDRIGEFAPTPMGLSFSGTF